jgi:hypothetical protein
MRDAVADLDHADGDLVADLASIRLAKRDIGVAEDETFPERFQSRWARTSARRIVSVTVDRLIYSVAEHAGTWLCCTTCPVAE